MKHDDVVEATLMESARLAVLPRLVVGAGRRNKLGPYER